MTRMTQSNFFPRRRTPYVSSGAPNNENRGTPPLPHPLENSSYSTIAASGAQISTPPLPLQANNDMWRTNIITVMRHVGQKRSGMLALGR